MLISVSLNHKVFHHHPQYMHLSHRDSAHVIPMQVSPQDLGYEIDQDELARELAALLPEELQHQSVIEVHPDDFERLYHWFIS